MAGPEGFQAQKSGQKIGNKLLPYCFCMKHSLEECNSIKIFSKRFHQFWWYVIFCFCCSVTQACLSVCNSTDCNMPGPSSCPLNRWCHPTISSSVTLFSSAFNLSQHQSLLKCMVIESAMPPNHLVFCRPLLLLPSIFCTIRVSSNELALWWVTKVFELLPQQSFQWIFRTDFLWDWLVWSCSTRFSQESSPTPKFKSISSSVLKLLYGPTVIYIHYFWKNHSSDLSPYSVHRWTFVLKGMSLHFNVLSRLALAFLPRSKRLLISWLQSPSAVILQPRKIKSVTVSIVSPSIFHKVMGPDAIILVFWMLSLSHLLHSPLSLSSRGSLVSLGLLP